MGLPANSHIRSLYEPEIHAFEVEGFPRGGGRLEESAVAQGMKGSSPLAAWNEPDSRQCVAEVDRVSCQHR